MWPVILLGSERRGRFFSFTTGAPLSLSFSLSEKTLSLSLSLSLSLPLSLSLSLSHSHLSLSVSVCLSLSLPHKKIVNYLKPDCNFTQKQTSYKSFVFHHTDASSLALCVSVGLSLSILMSGKK